MSLELRLNWQTEPQGIEVSLILVMYEVEVWNLKIRLQMQHGKIWIFVQNTDIPVMIRDCQYIEAIRDIIYECVSSYITCSNCKTKH